MALYYVVCAARFKGSGRVAKLVVLIDTPDRPGLLSEITGLLHRLGANLVTSLGYAVEDYARLLLIVDSPLEPDELKERIEEQLGEDAEVKAAPLGPEGAELLAEFLHDKPGLVNLLEVYLEPPDLLDALLRLPRDVRRRLYRVLSAQSLGGIMLLADEATLREIAESVDLDHLAKAIATLDPDEAVDVLQKLPEKLRRQLLGRLPEELRREALRLLRYPPDTAGGIMTTSIPVLRAGDTVQQALQLLRRGDHDVRDTIIVVDEEGHLVGLVTVDQLLRASPSEKLEKLAVRPRATVEPEVDREEVARLMLRYDINRLPVVDREGRFLGIVTVEDVADVLAEEAAEDIALLGGLETPRERYLKASIFDLFKSRLPWLLLIYAIESVTANIIKGYEDVIQRIAILAAFIPLVMDTGGNVGSQASSMIVRALALGEISERSRHDIVYVFLKELATATLIGSTLALIGFGFAMVLSGGNFMLSLSVALTLLIVTILADIIGATLPIIARRLGADPAAVSGPFVTTIVDISVALVYMGLATHLVLKAG
ncbi:divalent cation transporter [Pyrodictium delaneyi]|uniref:Magnesium transporter MgtE n=1 Tax=Pyrodictium delaneyi TaxID=1273541 RepID=A0A0P0N5L4_9CREN|nr:magnesium transporter [Pyrodictium delaneyi]ALL01820.1 divalent cation transporter [Pyrodictium delaneyi]